MTDSDYYDILILFGMVCFALFCAMLKCSELEGRIRKLEELKDSGTTEDA